MQHNGNIFSKGIISLKTLSNASRKIQSIRNAWIEYVCFQTLEDDNIFYCKLDHTAEVQTSSNQCRFTGEAKDTRRRLMRN